MFAIPWMLLVDTLQMESTEKQESITMAAQSTNTQAVAILMEGGVFSMVDTGR